MKMIKRMGWLGLSLAFTTMMSACSSGSSAEAPSTGGRRLLRYRFSRIVSSTVR
ncbi:hypothetical protein ACFSQ7_02210 [Paenibacillus rhizoplanae]